MGCSLCPHPLGLTSPVRAGQGEGRGPDPCGEDSGSLPGPIQAQWLVSAPRVYPHTSLLLGLLGDT